MPFDQANPADSEKIRRLGIVIRPNWKAIEEGSNDDANPNKLKYWSLNLYSRDDIPSAPGNDAEEVTDGLTLYSKTDADSGFPELFMRHEDNSITQLSKYPANIAPASRTSNGETFLPGGLLLKYADLGTVNTGSTAFTWAGIATSTELGLTAFPNNCFQVQIQRRTTGNSAIVTSVSTTGFTLILSGSSNAIYAIAIGN